MVRSWMRKAAAVAAGAVFVVCFGAIAWADPSQTIQENGLSITGNTAGIQKDEDGQLIITENGSYQITGTWKGTLENADAEASKAVLRVADNVDADLVFKNVKITEQEEFAGALALESGAQVDCTLSGENSLQGEIELAKGAALTLSGTGSLDTDSVNGTGSFALSSAFQGTVRTSEVSAKTDTSAWSGILFENGAGQVYGTPILSQNLTVGKSESLVVPKACSLTIGKSVQLQNNGTIKNQGAIYNYGTWKGNDPQENAVSTAAQIQVTLSAQEITFADGLTITATARVPQGTANGTATFWLGEIGGNGVKLGTAQAAVEGQQATAELSIERCGIEQGFAVGETQIYVDFGDMTGASMPGQSAGTTLTVTEIPRSIPAPAANAGDSLNIVAGAVTPSAGGGLVEYGVATENDTSKVTQWQTDPTFTGLQADTEYYVFARVTGDPEYSQAYAVTGPVKVPKASRTMPKPTAVAQDVCTISITEVKPSAGAGTVEYGIATENNASKVTTWRTGKTFANLKAGTTYYVFARVSGDSQYADACSESVAVKVEKAARTMPAPKGKAGGTDQIVLETAAPSAGGGTVEYGLSEKNDSNTVTNWQSGTTFTGLKAGTPYYCFARIKGDASYKDATSSSTVIFTSKAADTSQPSNPGTTTYSIQVTAGEGGSISPSSMQAPAGSTQTFKFTPKKGYEVANVRVDVTDFGSRTSYTFENVSGPHSLTVTFRPVKAASSSSSSSDKTTSSSSSVSSSSSSSSKPAVSSSSSVSSSASSSSSSTPTAGGDKGSKIPTVLLVVIALLVAAIAAVIIVIAVRRKKADSSYEEYEEYPRYVDDEETTNTDDYNELDMDSDSDTDDEK